MGSLRLLAASCCCVALILCNIMGPAAAYYRSANNYMVVSAKCDPRGMIPQGSSFWGHLGFLLQQLADNTPYTPYYSFKTRVGGGDAPAFGEAYCSASASRASCYACLRQLSTDIWRICNSTLGARVEYPDCWIHYEDYYF